MEPSRFRSRTHIPATTRTTLACGDCFALLQQIPDNSIHAVVTDPPFGLDEFDPSQVSRLRSGRGGLWRQPPRGRAPLPRFSVLNASYRDAVVERMYSLAVELERILVPSGHPILAAKSLLSYRIVAAVELSGFDKRGEVIRIVGTLRGGDRPKNAETEFPDISVTPRSLYEPWGLFFQEETGDTDDR